MKSKIDTYVACSMSGLPAEEYAKFRHIVLAVCDAFRDSGRVPYSEPFERGGFGKPTEERQKNLVVLDECTHFILLYTSKEATSALIELGYALKQGIPITVFAKEGVKLPFYLRDVEPTPSFNVKVILFKDEEELPELVRQL